jgi:hypothetical protein
VTDDPITLLERELLDAARRRAVPVAEPDSLAARRGLRRRLPGALAVAASVLVVVVVAGGALLALRHGPGRGRPTATRLVAPWAQRLTVLRRPQSHADQLMLYRDGNDLPPGIVAPGSVRYARRTPWGAPVLLGVKARGPQRGQLVLAMPTWSSILQVTLSGSRFDAGRGTVVVVGPKRASGQRVTRVVLPVGDGIDKVGVELGNGTPHTGQVVGNVAAIQIPSRCCTVHPFAHISAVGYGPGGDVVRRWRPTVETVVDPDGTTEN